MEEFANLKLLKKEIPTASRFEKSAAERPAMMYGLEVAVHVKDQNITLVVVMLRFWLGVSRLEPRNGSDRKLQKQNSGVGVCTKEE